jgi:acetyltransferase-like isoleucine patch superfamily enzyme
MQNGGQHSGGQGRQVYPYRISLARLLRAPGRLRSAALEYLTRVVPLPPAAVLRLHQARGVRFADPGTVYIRPLVQLAPRFPGDLRVGRDVFFDVCAMVLTDRLVPGSRPHHFTRHPVRIEDGVYVGMGAIVLPGVRLGRGAVVGAGAVVHDDVPPDTVVRGNPARPLETLPPVDRSRAARPAMPRGEVAYDERGVSLQAYPYQQSFFQTLVRDPALLARTLWTYCILNLPVPPRLATATYAWMGVDFERWQTSGVVLPIFMDTINPGGIHVGRRSHISSQVLLAAHFFDPRLPGFCYRKKRVTLADDVFIGMGSIVGDGLEVGAHSMISANSVLFADVQPNLGVIGNPARAYTRMPSKGRDPRTRVEAEAEFHDDTGKSQRVFAFDHRLAHVLQHNPRRVLSIVLDYFASALPLSAYQKALLHRLCEIQIEDPASVSIGHMVYLDRLAPERVRIGRDVTIQDRVRVLSHYPEPSVEGCFYRTGEVVIEDGVFLGACATIANNVRVGRGAVVLPGTLIVSDVPPGAVIGGWPPELLGRA